jgi:hypothetical protein
MEVVLLWLDELDDLVFTGIVWLERIRRVCLQLGLLAALALPVFGAFDLPMLAATSCAAFALASVCVWVLGLFSKAVLASRQRSEVATA